MDLAGIANVFQGIPLDWIIIGAIALFAAMYVLRSGAQMMCTVALALPVTALLLSALSNAVFLDAVVLQLNTPLLRAGLFVGIFLLSYVLVHRIGISFGSEAGQPIQALLAGTACAAVVTVVWVQEPSLQAIWQFGGDVQSMFGSTYRFWWILGSYAALAFVRR